MLVSLRDITTYRYGCVHDPESTMLVAKEPTSQPGLMPNVIVSIRSEPSIKTNINLQAREGPEV
jgi:hypothetical protein